MVQEWKEQSQLSNADPHEENRKEPSFVLERHFQGKTGIRVDFTGKLHFYSDPGEVVLAEETRNTHEAQESGYDEIYKVVACIDR